MPTAYELLAETKGSIENALAKMLHVKKDGAPRKELPELITSASVLFLNLRQINRVILQEEDRIKAETEAAKSPLDQTTLQLHNFLYEKSHYLKAIKACKDFKSKYPDIELVPEEEFFRDAPEEMLSDPAVRTDAHRLMLQRLNFEMHQRKHLCRERELLEARKKMLQENIASRKKFLSSLPSHLKALKKASLPVQQHLGILHTKHMKEHQLADLLPLPLYIVYTQLLSHKEAFGEAIDVEIAGSAKEAQALIKQQANQEAGLGSLDEQKTDDEVVEEEDDSQRRRKRVKRTHDRDTGGSPQVFQAHPLSVILHLYDDEEAENNKPAKLFVLRFEYLHKINAVSVAVEGHHEGNKADMLANLFPDDTGLDLPSQSGKLIADGVALDDPKRNVRCYKWAQHLAGIDFLSETPGRSSNSAEMSKQLSSGLAIYRQQNRVHTILKQLRSRRKSQLSLKEQLEDLHKLTKPALTYKKVRWAGPSKCNLKSWVLKGVTTDRGRPSSSEVVPASENEAGREDGELLPMAATAMVTSSSKDGGRGRASLDLQPSSGFRLPTAEHQVPVDSELEVLLEDDPEEQRLEEVPVTLVETNKQREDWSEYGCSHYCGVLKREEACRTLELEAQVSVAIDYPVRPPLFRLRLLSGEVGRARPSVPPGVSDMVETTLKGAEVHHKWFNELRAMEAKLNNHLVQRLPKWEANHTLAHQMALLCFLFDVQVDSNAASRTLDTQDVARSHRGRDRKIISGEVF